MAKRSKTDLCAVIGIDKPEGWTSHDVVGKVRRVTGERRVGHAGTLDPFATGVLIVGIGPATRLSDLVMAKSKEYVARIAFGTQTDTDDLTGEAVAAGPVPPEVLDRAFAQRALDGFTGTIMQTPPQYSAKKIDGRKAYDLARKGEAAEVRPVEVTVSRAELAATGEEGGVPFWDVRFEVSKGTYIRALARDIGLACGSFAHLTALRRMSTGGVSWRDCLSPEAFEEAFSPAWLEEACLDPVALLGHPAIEPDGAAMRRVSNGNSIEGPAALPAGACVSVVSGGRLHAVYESDGRGLLKCRIMIPGGVAGVR